MKKPTAELNSVVRITSEFLVLLLLASASSQVAAGPSACDADLATHVAYDITLGGATYQVAQLPGSSARGRRAFLKDERLVQDLNVTRRLARTAWVLEDIVSGTGALPYRSPTEQLLNTRKTFVEVRRYILVQDIIASAWVAAPTIVLKGVPSAPKVIAGVTWDLIRDRLLSLDGFLTHVAYKGVSDAITHYQNVDDTISQVRNTVLDATVAQQLYDNFVLGLTYERTSRGLMTGLMPKTGSDLLLRALRVVGRTAVHQLPKGTSQLSLPDVARARERLDKIMQADKTLNSLGAFVQYFEDYQFALRLVVSISDWIEEWAVGSIKACELLVLQPTPTPPAQPTPTVPSPPAAPPGAPAAPSVEMNVREYVRSLTEGKLEVFFGNNWAYRIDLVISMRGYPRSMWEEKSREHRAKWATSLSKTIGFVGPVRDASGFIGNYVPLPRYRCRLIFTPPAWDFLFEPGRVSASVIEVRRVAEKVENLSCFDPEGRIFGSLFLPVQPWDVFIAVSYASEAMAPSYEALSNRLKSATIKMELWVVGPEAKAIVMTDVATEIVSGTLKFW